MKGLLLVFALFVSQAAVASGAEVRLSGVTVTPNVPTNIIWSAADGLYDTADHLRGNSSFTATQYGRYILTVIADDNSATVGDYLTILVNGAYTLCNEAFSTATGSALTCAGATIFRMFPGDAVSLIVVSSTGTLQDVRMGFHYLGE